MNQPTILLVDDEQFSRKLYSEILEEDGYNLKTATNADEALSLIQNIELEILITDYVLPGIDGLSLAKKAKEIKPQLDVIIITAHGSMESAIEALKFGVSDYLLKPVNPEELKLTVKRLMSLRNAIRENATLKSSNELMRILNRLSLCLEPDHLIETSVNLVNNYMRSDACVYLEFQKDPSQYLLKAHAGLTPQERAVLPEIINRLHNGWYRRFSKAKVVKSPFLKMNLKKISSNFASFLIIPLVAGNKPAGILLLINKKKSEKFSQKSLKTAKIISGHIAMTLENCQKYISAKELAFIDELTGLYNTRYLDYFMESEIKRAKRQNYLLSFLFMDIDHFKKVNDTHGHLVGSRLLIEIGGVIRKCVRDIDVVIRYGGDEYIIILVNTPPDGAGIVGERLRDMIKNYTFTAGENLNIRVTASLGIATYPIHAQTKEEVIDLADKAMYKAKISTRDAVYIASEMLE